jgi:UDP-2-acetamido-3-amino-2,3-dideoxy-glucuronate N-acetyltransferase
MQKRSFAVAVAGCGRWGLNHVRTAYSLFGGQLKCVCDADTSRHGKVQEISPDIRFVASVDQIINDPEITAVILATPAETHYALAKQLLNSGRHTLVEKPLTLFSAQARELIELASSRNLVLMVGHVLLFHPAIRKLKELIDEGRLGKLQYVYSNRLNLGAVRREENILWSFAPHDISILQYLIGEDPFEVDARGAIFLQPGIHDVTLTSLRYPRNIHAHIHVSWLHPFKEHRLVVIGDKSMAVFDDSRQDNKLLVYPKGFDVISGEPTKRDGTCETVSFSSAMPLDLELSHFRECVENDQRPLADGENGLKVLEILERAQAALEEKDVASRRVPGSHQRDSGGGYFVHETALIDAGARIGKGTKIWHFSHVLPGASIGSNCTLGQNVSIGNQVKIGDFVKIQNNVSVYEGVELEDYVFCGPSMVFTNIKDPRCEFPQRGSEHYIRTLVRYGATIGANATIVAGVTIGRFAFIGAGAVVTKNVPDYALITGNPGCPAGWRCRCGETIKFTGDAADCLRCARHYSKLNEAVVCASD